MRVRARVHSVRNQTVKSSWYVAEELVTEDRIATISSKCLQVFKRRWVFVEVVFANPDSNISVQICNVKFTMDGTFSNIIKITRDASPQSPS